MYMCSNPRYPVNHGKFWSACERRIVRDMRWRGYTYGAIANRLGRTRRSVIEMHDRLTRWSKYD